MKKERIIYLHPEGLGEFDRDYFVSIGYISRYDWYKKTLHEQKGATLRQNIVTEIDKEHVRSTKGGGSTGITGNGGTYEWITNRKKYIPKPKNLENIFNFNYDDMLECNPNKKFNKVKSLVFNHEFEDEQQQEWYDEMVDKYNNLTIEELNKINNIYQRLSTYIKKNGLSRKWVDGSVICNVALMVNHLLQTGELTTNMDFYNSIETSDCLDEDNEFHLFLILQCFISHNHYYHKYVAGIPCTNWWAICKLQHRDSDRDMRSKGQIRFKDTTGKYIYSLYGNK